MQKPSIDFVRKLITGKSEPPENNLNAKGNHTSQQNKSSKQSRTNSNLNSYVGPWEPDHVRHLLARTTFGPTIAQSQSASNLTMTELLEQLLTNLPVDDLPLNVSEEDTSVPVGETWINATDGFENNNLRLESLVSWWTGKIINHPISIKEQMTLFWSNHFVTEAGIVEEARIMYHYINLLRQNALGNFKSLAKQITVNAAMLAYLNGDANEAGAANENYARELFELFTIGKGEQIAEGNYTNYTEEDVVAASKVLTGWKIDWLNASVYFDPSKHDEGDKQFSAAFNNQIIANNGENEYEDLIEMIFANKETARFLCRKIYRWFVYYHIDENIENNIIEPLATLLFDNNYEIAPVMAKLLASDHFYDPENRGCMIKNPLVFSANLLRQFEITFPTNEQYVLQYDFWLFVNFIIQLQEMNLGNPPGVAGWPAYYQEPQFHRIWVNSATLPFKRDLTNFFALTEGYEIDGFKMQLDPISIIDKLDNPSDPDVLIQDLIFLIYPIDINQEQKAFLKNVLIPGLPDFEWTVEWNDYKSDTGNAEKKQAVTSKLQALISTMMSMAEYQLS